MRSIRVLLYTCRLLGVQLDKVACCFQSGAIASTSSGKVRTLVHDNDVVSTPIHLHVGR